MIICFFWPPTGPDLPQHNSIFPLSILSFPPADCRALGPANVRPALNRQVTQARWVTRGEPAEAFVRFQLQASNVPENSIRQKLVGGIMGQKCRYFFLRLLTCLRPPPPTGNVFDAFGKGGGILSRGEADWSALTRVRCRDRKDIA
jgi:hypothetical protein